MSRVYQRVEGEGGTFGSDLKFKGCQLFYNTFKLYKQYLKNLMTLGSCPRFPVSKVALLKIFPYHSPPLFAHRHSLLSKI
jgi:hypothetical protein